MVKFSKKDSWGAKEWSGQYDYTAEHGGFILDSRGFRH